MTQVLKMTYPMQFMVMLDENAEHEQRYSIYYCYRKQNKYGYYTKRKKLVDRVHSMNIALATITDILNGNIPDRLVGIMKIHSPNRETKEKEDSMTNLQRFNTFSAWDYPYEGVDVEWGNDGSGIMRCWIVDGKQRIPNTTIFKVWISDKYDEADFERLKEAREYYKREHG